MMSIEKNDSQAAYLDPEKKGIDTGAGHNSGLDEAPSEPKQGVGEKPEDWNPPAGNPGSDQDAQTGRKNGGA